MEAARRKWGAIAGGTAVCNVFAPDSGVNLANCSFDLRSTMRRSEAAATCHRKPLFGPRSAKLSRSGEKSGQIVGPVVRGVRKCAATWVVQGR